MTRKPAKSTPSKKLPVEDLLKKMRDPASRLEDFAEYFVVDEAASRAFAPKFTFNEALVEIGPEPRARDRAALAIPFVMSMIRFRRRADFEQMLAAGYDGPLIVSEGDSWFNYPFLDDVIDSLSPPYAIDSLDRAGDTLDDMIAQDEYLSEIERVGASILLFSGGGNDVLGGGDLKTHLLDYDKTLTAAQHVRSSYRALLDRAIGQYDQILRRVAREAPGVHVVFHGYDYAIPDGGKWLGKPMEARGIVDLKLQRDIVRVLVDRFAAGMTRIAQRYPHAIFLDNRGVVGDGEWYDELHPGNAGFAKVAKRFAAAIKAIGASPRVLPKSRGARPAPAQADAGSNEPQLSRAGRRRGADAMRPTGLNRGLSLHLGLNKVDRNFYGSDCPLSGCHRDAEDMMSLALDAGYQPIAKLLDDAATTTALASHLEFAAKDLKAGDIFLLSYSGHGGQLADYSGDEADGMDETWCLYDREFLDDELYAAWRQFRDGVRILVVSDSCHSGSVIKQMPFGLVRTAAADALEGVRMRSLPESAAQHVARNHRSLYRSISSQAAAAAGGDIERRARSREIDAPLACTVRLLSACQDNQLAADFASNGLFTMQLILALDRGYHGDYAQFVKALSAKMPTTQSPQHYVVGRADPAYDAQQPFEI
jgi:hypothetical protein